MQISFVDNLKRNKARVISESDDSNESNASDLTNRTRKTASNKLDGIDEDCKLDYRYTVISHESLLKQLFFSQQYFT